MQARLGRSQRDAEHARHLGQRHPKEVMHHDDGAPFGVEVPKRLIDEVPVGERADVKSDVGRAVDRRQFDLDRAVPPSAHDVDAGMDGRAGEARRRTGRDRAAPAGPPGADECLLDPSRASSGSLRISRAAASSRAMASLGKHREGVMIAPLRPLDEVSLVHDSPRSRRGHPVAL